MVHSEIPTLNSRPIAPAQVNRDFVLAKCNYFVNVQLWPLKSKINPEQWLSNFTSDEIDHAVHLLNSFIFFPDAIVNQLFVSAFQDLSRTIRRPSEPFISTRAAWKTFCSDVLITYVTGETPNATDSGYTFARKARQLIDITENRILSPNAVLNELIANGPRPVVFVDDFVGSGNQFLATWNRPVRIRDGHTMSFQHYASVSRQTDFFYCPLVCTQYGREQIVSKCPVVTLNSAHYLPPTYSAIADNSVIWPEHLRQTGPRFVETASRRAGIPEDKWRGYRNLGLALAFDHGVPDATLPIFYWNSGWKPLQERK